MKPGFQSLERGEASQLLDTDLVLREIFTISTFDFIATLTVLLFEAKIRVFRVKCGVPKPGAWDGWPASPCAQALASLNESSGS